MKEITLTNGMITQVDADIFLLIGHRTFYPHRRKKSVYPCCSIEGHSRLLHQIVLGPAPPGFQSDHKNGDTLDNRRENLRWATCLQNQRNRGKKAGSKSQYKGVNFRMGAPGQVYKRPWRARIKLEAKALYLGNFYTEVEAARAYDAAARVHFGEFARLNFP